MATKLYSLPPEIISHITSFLKTKYAFSLMLTGDLALRMRLSAGGVDKLLIELNASPKHFPPPDKPRSPRFNLDWCTHLTSLSVIATQTVHERPWNAETFVLPKTLREIRFSFPDDSSDFTKLLSSKIDPLPHLQSLTLSDACNLQPLQRLSKLEFLSIGSGRIASCLKLKYLPPHLHTLQVGLDAIKSRTKDGTIFRFPTSLTSLTLMGSASELSLEGLLSPGLLKVDLDIRTKVYIGILAVLPDTVVDLSVPHFQPNLPPYLTRLTDASYGEPLPSNLWQHLPHTLTATNIVFRLDETNVDLLPPRLQAIQGRSISSALLPKLPSTLTRLKMSQPYVGGSLPTTLTVLGLDHFDISWAPHLPASLTSLSSFGTSKIDPAFWSIMGSKVPELRHLKFKPNSLRFSFDALAHFPRKLLTLDMDSGSPQGGFELLRASHVALLPRTLMSLTLSEFQLAEPDALKHLPKGLLRLSMYAHELPLGCIDHDMPQLTLLNISLAKPCTGFGTHLMAHLPRSLKLLRYETAARDPISDAAIANLPESLCEIFIPATEKISNSAIIKAPRLPKYIRVNGRVPQWHTIREKAAALFR